MPALFFRGSWRGFGSILKFALYDLKYDLIAPCLGIIDTFVRLLMGVFCRYKLTSAAFLHGLVDLQGLLVIFALRGLATRISNVHEVVARMQEMIWVLEIHHLNPDFIHRLL